MGWYPECSEIARFGRFRQVLYVLTKRWKPIFELGREKKSIDAEKPAKRSKSQCSFQSVDLGDFADFSKIEPIWDGTQSARKSLVSGVLDRYYMSLQNVGATFLS